VSRVHRGREVPCPGCGGALRVPDTLDFRGELRDALRDRRSGYRAMAIAWCSALLCFLPIPVVAAGVWWWVSRRIHDAREAGREVAEPLLAARVVAAVGCLGQLAFWVPVGLRLLA
jgi:hypothetical protein